MAAPYSGTSVSGYNSNPPPDDGSTVSTNLITWSGIKTKVGDPLNTFATNVDANITSAFTKTLDGSAVVATAVDYAAGAADQGRLINVTVSGKTVTTPDAGTVNTPFIFGVTNRSGGTINLAPNAANSQQIDGSTSALVVQSGGSCLVKTDGTNWFTVAYKPGANALSGSNYGFVPPVNASISCSVGSNLLTVALKTKAGNDPSASDPVLVAFRDTTLTAGDPVWVTISSALSINTNATGATLASQNGKPFRFWIVLFNNGGTPVLALWHSGAGASSIAINPLNESTLQSTTGMSAGSTSAGVFYTPNGTTLTNKAFRILGYLEYTSGLATAGTYTAAPDIVQLFGPGIAKPGQAVQTQLSSSNTVTTISSSTKTTTSVAGSISPTSSANLIKAKAFTNAICSGATTTGFGYAQIGRTSNSNMIGSVAATGVIVVGVSGVNSESTIACYALDQPFTTSSTTYTLYGWANNTNVIFQQTTNGAGTNSGYIELEEIQA